MFRSLHFIFLILFLLIILPVEIFYTKKLKNIFSNKELIVVRRKSFIRIFCYTLSFLSFVIYFCKPQFGSKHILKTQSKTEIFFVVDVSKSMNLKDVNYSRMEISKAIIKILNHELEKIQTGLVLFKGTAILSLPLTLDKNIFDIMLDTVSSYSITTPGTNIEDACNIAIKNFSKNNSVQKIIILFTDGDETIGNIKRASQLLKNNNVTCFCVGVGSTFGSKLKIYDNEGNDKIIISKLYENVLKNFIENIDNKYSQYFKADSINLVETLKTKIEYLNLPDRVMDVIENTDHFTLFISLGFTFLLIGFLFGEHICSKKY